VSSAGANRPCHSSRTARTVSAWSTGFSRDAPVVERERGGRARFQKSTTRRPSASKPSARDSGAATSTVTFTLERLDQAREEVRHVGHAHEHDAPRAVDVAVGDRARAALVRVLEPRRARSSR
jgi:hypothetical protein